MPQNDPRRSGQSYSITLRPFVGRNSDIDQASIESNQASGGTNWVVKKGTLFRRPTISRIGQLATLPCGTSNDIHALVQVVTPDTPIVLPGQKTAIDVPTLRVIGRGGLFEIDAPTIRGAIAACTYNAGTVSLSTGNRTMAGTNTAWLSRGVHPGASVTVGSQTFTIRSVNSDTSIELTTTPSSGGTGLSYSTARYATYMSERSLGDGRIQPARYLVIDNSTAPVQVTGGNSVHSGGLTVTGTGYTPGSRAIVVSVNYPGSWLRAKNDLGTEIDGLNRHADFRVYRKISQDVLGERFRGTANAGSANWYLTLGLRGHMGPGPNHLYVIGEKNNPAGTVSIIQGSTTVRGTGTAFSSTLALRAGDEIYFTATGRGIRHYRIASVVSNTTLTLGHAFDQSTVSGVTFGVKEYRAGTTIVESVTTQSLSGCRISQSMMAGLTGFTAFSPTFWSWNSEPDRRFQVAVGIFPDPQVIAATHNYEQMFICTTQHSNIKQNIFWAYDDNLALRAAEQSILPRTLTITSNIAPLAKLIECWNGRVFAADLKVYDQIVSSTTPNDYPLRLMWTRVNEPYSWWNQYPTDGAGAANINNGTGDLIAMKQLGTQNALVIYRGFGITMLRPTGDSINPFTQDYLNMGPGPVGPDAIIPWENGHLYLGRDGRFLNFNGSRVDVFPSPLTRFIEDNIDWTYAHWTQAVRNEADGEFMWFIPTTASRNLTYAIVYNQREGQWYIQDFTARPLQAVAYVDKLDYTLERRLFAVDSNRNLVAFRSDGPGVDFVASIGGGTLFSSRWISKEMVLPIPDLTSEDREKEVNAVEVAYDPTYSGRLQMEVSGDGGINWTNFGTNTLTSGSTAGTSLSRGNGMVVGRTHMVRLTQTPANTTTDTSMSLRWLRIHYADYGAVPA